MNHIYNYTPFQKKRFDNHSLFLWNQHLHFGGTRLFLKIIHLFFSWRIIALQNFAVFCQTSTWINHRCTYVPSLLKRPPPSTPLSLDVSVVQRWGSSPASVWKTCWFTHNQILIRAYITMPLAAVNSCIAQVPCYSNNLGKMTQSKWNWVWEDESESRGGEEKWVLTSISTFGSRRAWK